MDSAEDFKRLIFAATFVKPAWRLWQAPYNEGDDDGENQLYGDWRAPSCVALYVRESIVNPKQNPSFVVHIKSCSHIPISSHDAGTFEFSCQRGFPVVISDKVLFTDEPNFPGYDAASPFLSAKLTLIHRNSG